jgi:hypothetical protein
MNFRRAIKYMVSQINVARFTNPLHRDVERVREETVCMLLGGKGI